jgi:eukaryotic-like serine/threonine-protein kinase
MELIGRTLGQYRIIEKVGQGGMATVFKAYQPNLDRFVAIKIMAPQHAQTPGFKERKKCRVITSRILFAS